MLTTTSLLGAKPGVTVISRASRASAHVQFLRGLRMGAEEGQNIAPLAG